MFGDGCLHACKRRFQIGKIQLLILRSVFMYLPIRSIALAGIVMLLSHINLTAQISAASALNRIEKGNWLKAEMQLRKALKKDTLNPEARYVYTLLFFNNSYPRHNIDTAYHYVLASLWDFQKSELRQKERMKRFPLDSSILVDLRKKIDSAAFERAKTVNTVNSYQYFLDQFNYASQQAAAVELRDEVAFIGALKINTYKIFKVYLDQYPSSHRKEDALKRYEKLLFEDKTKDGKLKSYETFLKEYPATPYRRETEKNIFEISTANGKFEAFEKYIQSYPESNFRKKAEDILYHLRQVDEHTLEAMAVRDSLARVQELDKGFWVPILKNEKFGFMDETGKEMIAPRFDFIYDEYKCGDIRTDFLITSEGIISRGGKTIFKGITEEVIDLGLGFLKVQDSVCIHIVHKSGYQLNYSCLEDVRLVANRFVGYKQAGKWGLIAMNGRNLLPAEFEDVYSLEEVIVLVKSGKRSLKTPEQVAVLADKNSFSESVVFDEVRLIEPGIYLVKNGALEGTVNSKLDFLIPLDRQTLNKTPYGYVTKKNEKFKVIGMANVLSGEQFDEVRFYENWLSLKNGNGLSLFSISGQKNVATQLDSIWFLNHLAFGLREDSLYVFLSTGLQRRFSAQSDFNFIKASDGQLFFYTTEKNKKTVYDASTGGRLFQLDFDEIEYFDNQIFMITRDGKRGLLSSDGKPVLPLEYSVIVITQKGYASLLKDKKFGLFDLQTKKLIKPLFERNVKPFRENFFIAYKDGYFGFIDNASKPQGKFEFEEILEWNDSTALVKKNFQWMIYDWKKGKISFSKIKDYRMVLNTEDEKIMIIHQENAYGVISNKFGTIIPSTFSDIVNIGSDEELLYFTEKNIEEASIYVVIYYNKKGKLLRRQVFEKEEYEQIYCED